MDDLINKFIKKIYTTLGTLDIHKVIEHYGIEIRYVSFLNNPLGQSVNVLGERVILISDKVEESNLKYFILAHELYHAAHHIELSGYYIRDSISRGKLENEANKFAIAFFINKYVEDYGKLPHSYDELTYLYGVPKEVIKYYI